MSNVNADVVEEFFREPSLVWRLDVSFEGELEIFRSGPSVRA